MDQPTRMSLIAAHQAVDATAALLLFNSEGHLGDIPIVEKLAEAMSIAIGIELDRAEECDLEYRSALIRLRSEADVFIEGWAG